MNTSVGHSLCSKVLLCFGRRSEHVRCEGVPTVTRPVRDGTGAGQSFTILPPSSIAGQPEQLLHPNVVQEGSSHPQPAMAEAYKLSETALFMESMVADMEARAHAITTLDTTALCGCALLSTRTIQAAAFQGNMLEDTREHTLVSGDQAMGGEPLRRFLDGKATACSLPQAPVGMDAGHLGDSCGVQPKNTMQLLLAGCNTGLQGVTALSAEAWLSCGQKTTSPPSAYPHRPALRAVDLPPALAPAASARSDGNEAKPVGPEGRCDSRSIPGGATTAQPTAQATAETARADTGSSEAGATEAPAGAASSSPSPGRVMSAAGAPDRPEERKEPTCTSPVLLPSLLQLLGGIADVRHAPLNPGACSGVALLGTWHGARVGVKLDFHPAEAYAGASFGFPYGFRQTAQSCLTAASRACRLRHPNLLSVLEVRAAPVDEESLNVLDPAPVLRVGWGGGGSSGVGTGLRPMGRLHRFLASQGMPQGPVEERLTVYPQDPWVVTLPPLTPAQRALASLRPRPGGVVIATLTEFVEAADLEFLACSADSPFRPSRAWTPRAARRALLRTAREIATALRVLHAFGTAHGSLRPCNVLLDRSDADARGFIARLSYEVGGSTALALSAHGGGVINSALARGQMMVFLAPEVLVGSAAAPGVAAAAQTVAGAAAADVYAFGMLVYLMAAGEVPFQGQQLVPVLMAVTEGLRPEWPTGHHDYLEPLFSRCVAQRPEDRPSLKEVVAEVCVLEERIKDGK